MTIDNKNVTPSIPSTAITSYFITTQPEEENFLGRCQMNLAIRDIKAKVQHNVIQESFNSLSEKSLTMDTFEKFSQLVLAEAQQVEVYLATA